MGKFIFCLPLLRSPTLECVCTGRTRHNYCLLKCVVASHYFSTFDRHPQNKELPLTYCLFARTRYVFPATTRARMAHLFEDESVVRWWLPNNEGFTPVLQRVRAFADERSNSGVGAGDGEGMKEVFDALVDLQLLDARGPGS